MRRAVFLLGLLAVLLAGMIPSGWMPVVAQESGKVLLVLCTSDGPQERWVDLDAGLDADPSPTHEDHQGDRSCPFAAMPALPAPLALQLPLPLMGPEQDLWYRAPFTHHTAGYYWRYDARGPPALS